MITMQGLLVLISAILGAAIAAGLTLAAGGTWPAALLAGGSAALAVARRSAPWFAFCPQSLCAVVFVLPLLWASLRRVFVTVVEGRVVIPPGSV